MPPAGSNKLIKHGLDAPGVLLDHTANVPAAGGHIALDPEGSAHGDVSGSSLKAAKSHRRPVWQLTAVLAAHHRQCQHTPVASVDISTNIWGQHRCSENSL